MAEKNPDTTKFVAGAVAPVRFLPPVACARCAQLWPGDKTRCNAFPQGIPRDILDGEDPHTTPHLGDHGIQFTPASAELER
jgi:hypothetical protein